MAQNSNGYHNTPHGSPPPHTSNDYGGLMGSLISPGPETPQQSAFPQPWPGQAGWQQNGGHGNLAFAMQYQGAPSNQNVWQQNGQQAWMPQEDGDEELFTVDDTDILGLNGQHLNQNDGHSGNIDGSHNHQQFQAGKVPNLSSSSTPAPSHSQLQKTIAGGTPQVSKSPKVNSAARAAELRAKLLANRSSNTASRQGSPAIRSNELNEAKKAHVHDYLRQANGVLASHIGAQRLGENTVLADEENRTDGESTMQSLDRSLGKTVTNTDFDDLFAEAQNAADARKLQAGFTNGKNDSETNVALKPEVTKGVRQFEAAAHMAHPALKKSHSISELSEPGEIHSETSSPSTAKQNPRLLESREAKQAKEDKKEKLMRQNEVNKAYQPLKASRAPTLEPTLESRGRNGTNHSSSLSTTKDSKSSDDSRVGSSPTFKARITKPYHQLGRSDSGQMEGEYEPPPVHEESRRDQHRERARDYDRRDDERIRRPSLSQQYSRESDSRRDVEARRQKHMDDNARRTEDNARRAAEYKKGLEAQRAPVRHTAHENSRSKEGTQKHEAGTRSSQASTANALGNATSLTTNNMRTSNDESGDGDRDPDTIMLDPRVEGVESKQDINDWLDMTNFHDQVFREKRLGIYRKKRVLEMQQAELEREENELQGIPYVPRAQSIFPASNSPKVTRRASIVNPKMPPPPVPLKEANNDVGIKIKDSALSSALAISQSIIPTLKRQHAEDDAESRRMLPADKSARLDMNGHAANDKTLTSPATTKGTTTPIKAEPTPLETRISRDDSNRTAAHPRGRSRSPEFRRRSVSPHRRRYSDEFSPEPRAPFHRNHGGIVRDSRTCHNCGQMGHYQHQCTEPRRDGKEWNKPISGYQQWVSPNYRGRNPLAREDTRPDENRPRFGSLGKTEESTMTIPRDNIGSRYLKLEAGGQYRLVRR